MDDKLWRCSRFFTHKLLMDRKYTYALRRFETSRQQFEKLHAACKSLAVFVDHIRIQGTMSCKVAKADRRIRSAKADNNLGSVGAASAGNCVGNPVVNCVGNPSSDAPNNLVPAKFLVYFAPSACWGGGVGGGGGGGGGTGGGGGGGTGTRGGGGAGSGFSSAAAAAGGQKRGSGSKSFAGAGASGGSNGGADASFGKQQAEALIAYMHANNILRLFLVTGSSVTAPAQKLLERAVHVEYWPVAACLSCAETHQTVPKCRRLTPREKKQFYAHNGISAVNLPRMLVNDRMSKYWGFVPGDVVELQRKTHVGIVKGEMRVVTHA